MESKIQGRGLIGCAPQEASSTMYFRRLVHLQSVRFSISLAHFMSFAADKLLNRTSGMEMKVSPVNISI